MLLVEDSPADLYLIQRAMADCGPHLVLWVLTRGSEVVPFLRRQLPFPFAPTPELILLDLRLPDADGHALLVQLRQLPASQRTPVIIVSGAARKVEEPRCLQLGANAYVQKHMDFPVNFRTLKTSLHYWLEKSRE